MSDGVLPGIRLGALEVSRLIVGGNPISGFSHQSDERSRAMMDYFTVARIKDLWRACEHRGITALVSRADAFVMRILAEYWNEGGQLKWIAQTAPEHRDPLQNIRSAHRAGASAIFVHGGDVGRLCLDGQTDALRERIDLIHSLGLPAGVAAHDPCDHLMIQEIAIPTDFHMVCMYNLTGYLGRRDITPKEEFDFSDRARALNALRQIDRPCIAYKIYGAGRLSADVAYADVGAALRPKDAVLVGMFPPDHTDIIGENVSRVTGIR